MGTSSNLLPSKDNDAVFDIALFWNAGRKVSWNSNQRISRKQAKSIILQISDNKTRQFFTQVLNTPSRTIIIKKGVGKTEANNFLTLFEKDCKKYPEIEKAGISFRLLRSTIANKHNISKLIGDLKKEHEDIKFFAIGLKKYFSQRSNIDIYLQLLQELLVKHVINEGVIYDNFLQHVYGVSKANDQILSVFIKDIHNMTDHFEDLCDIATSRSSKHDIEKIIDIFITSMDTRISVEENYLFPTCLTYTKNLEHLAKNSSRKW